MKIGSSSETAKVAVASVIGTTLESYDFGISGLAASLAWPTVFFPGRSLAVGVLLSLTTYVLGYFARPIGGLIFGEIGDRYGRKNSLALTLVVMGLGSLAIGLTPPYSQVGLAGPVLIVIFRVLQGLGFGGEWGGAASWVTEIASKSKWRGFWASWIMNGLILGSMINSGVFSLVTAAFDRTTFLSWGWRIPFFVGAIVALVGIIIRMTLEESPVFQAMRRARGKIEKAPVIEFLKKEPKNILKLTAIYFGQPLVFYIATVYSVSFLTVLGVGGILPVLALTIGNFLALFGNALGGIFTDKLGRRNTLLIGSVLVVVLQLPFFMLLGTKDAMLIILGFAIYRGLVMLGNAAIPSFFAETFPTKYRYSASAFTLGLGTSVSAVVSLIPPYLVVLFGNPVTALPYVASVPMVSGVVGMISYLFIKETKTKTIEDDSS
jgi:MFS family permease